MKVAVSVAAAAAAAAAVFQSWLLGIPVLPLPLVQLVLLPLLLLEVVEVEACDFANIRSGSDGAPFPSPSHHHHHHHRALQQQLQQGEAAGVTVIVEPENESESESNNSSTSNNDTTAGTTTSAPPPTTTTTTTPSSCTVDPTFPLQDTRVELHMVARQTRGILVLSSNCQFQVERLEIALDGTASTSSSIDWEWHYADSLQDEHVANRKFLAPGGTNYTANQLVGNYTSIPPIVIDIDNVDLASVGAILLCERIKSASSTNNTKVLATALIQKLKPGPAADLLADQPTMFQNCLTVSPTARLRWSIVTTENNDNGDTDLYLDIGFEYVVPYNNDAANTWMAFGPAAPGIQDRLMGGSDVVIAGFRQEEDEEELIVGQEEDEDTTATTTLSVPFSHDYYIGGYDVCTKLQLQPEEEARVNDNDNDNNTVSPARPRAYDGVCRDSIWSNTRDEDKDTYEYDYDVEQDDDNNAELLYSHILEGVAFLRIRRPLKAVTPEFDHDIIPGTRQHFVWAKGPLDPTMGIAEVQFHGYQMGQLKNMDMNKTTWSCAPLEGIELDNNGNLSPNGHNNDNDEFAQQFDHHTVLQGDVVEVFWTLMPETSRIHIGARAMLGSASSQWLSIAVGESMTDAWAWVATLEDGTNNNGEPQLLTYRMSGLDASTVRLSSTAEQSAMMLPEATHNVSSSPDGRLSFQVVAAWPLPGMAQGTTAAPIIYAIGPSWRGPPDTSPRRQDEHSIRSKAPTIVDFATGAGLVGQEPQNSLLLIHGAFMWLAWLVVAPMTSVASRYVRNDPCLSDVKGPSWIQIHKNGAATVMVLSLIGLILAVVGVADVGLRHIASSHAKVGIALLAMVTVQNFFGVLRPPADDPPVTGLRLTKRRLWSWSHRVFAISMLSVAVAAVITGSISLPDYNSRARYGVPLSIAWIALVVFLLVVYEIRRGKITGAATVVVATLDNMSKEAKEHEMMNGADDADDEAPIDKNEPIVETALPSPWISSCLWVYGVPLRFGALVLVVLTAIAFSGSQSLGNQTTEAAASAVAVQPPTGETSVDPTSQPNVEPLVDPLTNMTAFSPPELSGVDPPEGCTAWPPSHVGDGWCDDYEPFNSAACGWDGGDCCDTYSPLYNCKDPDSPNFGSASPRGWVAPIIPRNPRYSVSREESLESFVISYNNYYEFGLSKDIVEEANKHADFLSAESWYVDISGLVENPMTLDVKALISQMQLEERLYRHRCVEAWSITAPWIGFPLAKLLDMVKPKADAAIVQFVSWKNFDHSISQSTATGSYYPWPYTEALRIDEARNELTMVTVGAFGKPLTPQQGAPIRLTVPWKYGFKSVKSFEKINFLADDADSRRTFWSESNPYEYGFYANVNPLVPHKRWSQATERHYVEGYPGTRLDTSRMNGYEDQVDYLYDDIDDNEIYY